jgi:hypothetical protein
MSDATTIVAAGFTSPNFIAREDHSGIEIVYFGCTPAAQRPSPCAKWHL